jgi:hypothetical protein
LYAKLLSDCQSETILNAMSDDVMKTKRRLAELMTLYVDIDSVSSVNQLIQRSRSLGANSANLRRMTSFIRSYQ